MQMGGGRTESEWLGYISVSFLLVVLYCVVQVLLLGEVNLRVYRVAVSFLQLHVNL